MFVDFGSPEYHFLPRSLFDARSNCGFWAYVAADFRPLESAEFALAVCFWAGDGATAARLLEPDLPRRDIADENCVPVVVMPHIFTADPFGFFDAIVQPEEGFEHAEQDVPAETFRERRSARIDRGQCMPARFIIEVR